VVEPERVCAHCGEALVIPAGRFVVTERSVSILDGQAIEHVVTVGAVDVHRCVEKVDRTTDED
jgi:hypothetical protein